MPLNFIFLFAFLTVNFFFHFYKLVTSVRRSYYPKAIAIRMTAHSGMMIITGIAVYIILNLYRHS